MRAHTQQVAACDQADDDVVLAPKDRRPADFSGSHAVGVGMFAVTAILLGVGIAIAMLGAL